jgi:CheY-like chemotaxis protein
MPLANRQHHLERILTQGHRGAHLIRQVLDFSRTSICRPRIFDLIPFLKESIEFLKRTIPENIQIIYLELDPDHCQIKADPTQIQQVITNLAVNARDAMPTGGALKLRLSTFTLERDEPPPDPQLSPGQWITLSVSDTGSGIPEANLNRIFEPFFTTKSVGEGAGLGLAQVYGIVKQHQGHIKIRSQEAQGTTVTLYLPALLPEEESPVLPQEVAVPSGQNEMILLVEDEPEVLEVGEMMLKSLGYRVLMARNGSEALDLYALYGEEIALILSDMVMPEMDGVTLFQTLKRQHPGVKVVMMTGYPLMGKEAKALIAQGVVDCLQKPIELSALNRAISEALRATSPY